MIRVSLNFTSFGAPNANDISFSPLHDVCSCYLVMIFLKQLGDNFRYDYPSHPTTDHLAA